MATLRPMTDEEFERFRVAQFEDYVQERARNSGMSIEHERAVAAKQFESLQAQGMHTPGHHYWHMVDDAGAVVGSLWVYVSPGSDSAFIYDIVIVPGQRGKGLGKTTLDLLDAWARDRGVKRIGLNVFGDNTVAQGLYRKHGYQVDAIAMHKRL
jgi:ribosomal protein S18 acetylase RimI-like enzyme